MTAPLIGPDELGTMVADGTVVVLDVRYRMGGPGGEAEYAAGHIPSAVYVDLDTELADPPGPGGRHPLPDPARFAAAMRRHGVSGRRPVVVYDDWQGHAAARARWLLRHHGHSHVRLLDGGWAAWVRAGGPVATGPAETVTPGDFVVGTEADPNAPAVGAEELVGLDVLIDARAPERFRGEVEPVDPVAGRIPGSVNVPTSTNLRADGRFRDPAELREQYAAVGAVPGARVAAYCGSGVTACHDLLALELAGVAGSLYPGSWSGWITDPERPVEQG